MSTKDICPFCNNTNNVQCDDGVFGCCPMCELISSYTENSEEDQRLAEEFMHISAEIEEALMKEERK